MLKSKSVAKIIEDELNSIDADEQFKILDSVGDYKGSKINGILKQGKSTITPIMNYINATVPYTLEIIVPYQCGEDRADNIVNIVNSFIKKLNGKVRVANGGKIIFLFDTINLNEYETRATVGSSAKLGVTFVVNYSNKDVGTKYEMALLNNDFVGTINTRYFKDQEEQYKWYYNKITNAPFSELLTPNINSLVISQQRYINEVGTDINELSMYNYAIIRETKKDGTINHYYYEVTNANVDQYNILSVDLKMDTLQTWYFNPNIEFDDCFVTKANIDRFVPYGSGVRFNTKENSPLFEREEFKNVEKRLVKRDVVSILKTGRSKLDNWYKENVLGWIYIYINGGHVYNMGEANDSTKSGRLGFSRLNYTSYSSKENGYYMSMWNTLPCLCVPVYKTSKQIIMREGNIDLKFSTSAINSFVGNNKKPEDNSGNSGSYIYTIKFSIVPPFDVETIEESGWYVDDDDNLIIESVTAVTSSYIYISDNDKIQTLNVFSAKNGFRGVYGIRAEKGLSDAYFCVTQQRNINIKIPYAYGEDCLFLKSEIVGADKNPKFNPKLYNSDYMSLRISDNTQNGADYDILKLGADGIVQLQYTEALTPDITKKYIRIFKKNDYCIYDAATTENLTGFVNSDDTSLILETSAFQSMLANNKNFFLQNSTNRAFDIGQGIFNAGAGALQGAFFTGGNPIGALVGAGVSIANTTLSAIKSKTNENFNVDNLKNAPNSINGVKGNAIFNTMFSDTGIVVETYDILPYEKEIINDNMVMYGMTVNKVGSIKTYDNIRRYHNYIEANIEGIKGISISNAIREDIRQRFTNGVRFWNMVDGDFVISYEKENYERWLED